MLIIIVLTVAGLTLGSFINALVWRLHELGKIKKHKITTRADLNKLRQLSIFRGRSICPNCKHQLAAEDLIPLVSWLLLRGKCRYCHRPISFQYPLVELLTVVLFIFSYYFWPVAISGHEVSIFILWLLMLVVLIALAVYDIRWHLLPNILVSLLAILSVSSLLITIFTNINPATSSIEAAVWGVLIIGGSFYALFQLSKGEWIGGGDVKLGAVLGIIVGGPLASILLLFIASTSGTLYALPFIITGKAQRKTRIPFGPFLIVAAIITRLFGQSIINWYKQLYF